MKYIPNFFDEFSMKYIMIIPIYNIESNALLTFVTNDPYRRGE